MYMNFHECSYVCNVHKRSQSCNFNQDANEPRKLQFISTNKRFGDLVAVRVDDYVKQSEVKSVERGVRQRRRASGLLAERKRGVSEGKAERAGDTVAPVHRAKFKLEMGSSTSQVPSNL